MDDWLRNQNSNLPLPITKTPVLGAEGCSVFPSLPTTNSSSVSSAVGRKHQKIEDRNKLSVLSEPAQTVCQILAPYLWVFLPATRGKAVTVNPTGQIFPALMKQISQLTFTHGPARDIVPEVTMAHLLPVVSSLDMSALAPVGCPSDLSLGRAWDVSMKHPPPHPAHRSGELAMPLLFFPSCQVGFPNHMCGVIFWGQLPGSSFAPAAWVFGISVSTRRTSGCSH